ncbi:MAG: repeat containing protein [Cyanobacteria bacterium RYN_339]|nr:repeat containing protein [Cyanobacteria bacterium RYN_339]
MDPRRLAPFLALFLAAGCPAPNRTAAIKPKATAGPVGGTTLAVPQAGTPTTLTGKVKLIAGAGGALVGNNGGSIISDGGGEIISDNGGGIISNNGGGVVSNNGGGVISDHGAGYRLRSAAGLAGFALADAAITFTDAAGRTLVDEKGKPLGGQSDRAGAYSLKAVLPKGNVVAHIHLWNGGELAALVVPDGSGNLALDLDTASTLGATYVLGNFVKGDQAVYDRLPLAEATRLRTELDVVRRYLAGAPRYQAADLIAATDALRKRVPAVDRTIEDVKALLLGQAKLGAGRLATEVPIAEPRGLFVDPAGNLVLAEYYLGRIRSVAPDGKLSTVADAGSGRIKQNIFKINDMVRAKDGTLYVASQGTNQVFRIDPQDHVEPLIGNIAVSVGPIAGPLDTAIYPLVLAIGPDGTLYIGEFSGSIGGPPRLLAYSPDGKLTVVPIDATWASGEVRGLDFGPDGALYVLHYEVTGASAVYRWADGKSTRLPDAKLGDDVQELAVGADGTLYVAQERAGRVVAIAPDGTSRSVAGAGGPAATAALKQPHALAMAADGTLYIGDNGTSLVYALGRDGGWRQVAGSEAVVESGDSTSFAINQPFGVAYDADGSLFIVEAGGARVRRFRNGRLDLVAGSVNGFGGDGGPATAGLLSFPTNLVRRDGTTWIAETGGMRIRELGTDGTITTALRSLPAKPTVMLPGTSAPAAVSGIFAPVGLAVDAQHRLYWSTTAGSQVLRFTPGADGGTIEALAGKYQADTGEAFNPLPYLTNDETDPHGLLGYPISIAFDPKGDLYVAELITCGIMRFTGLNGGTPRLERVAGRSMAEMFAAAAATAAAATAAAGTAASPPAKVRAKETTLVFPTHVSFDAAGNMYICEAGTIHATALGSVFGASLGAGLDLGGSGGLGLPRVPGCIRKVTPDGMMTTIAGRGSKFFPDDDGDNALIVPIGLAIAPDGRMAIADIGANLIRILPAGSY